MLPLRAVLAGSLLFVTTAAAQVPSLSTATRAETTVPARKSPTAARLIGIIPGVGHMYAGEFEHGLLYATAIPSLVLAGALVGGLDCLTDSWLSGQPCDQSPVLTLSLIAAGGLWAWSIFDAGRAARRTNAKRAANVSLLIEPRRIPGAPGDDRAAVRLGVRISTW
jgi:hypothetical protein